jgi:hypothetical protein
MTPFGVWLAENRRLLELSNVAAECEGDNQLLLSRLRFFVHLTSLARTLQLDSCHLVNNTTASDE